MADLRRLGTDPPRGMRDILPNEAELRDATVQTLLTIYRQYGFRRVETPALESIELLTQGEGGENEKLIFKILKRGEKLDLASARSDADLVDLGLRFDLTVPLVRYYAHNHARLPRPLKAVQIGPVWRAERPQRGRFRQFTQCDIDILGVRSEIAEIELILATTEALAALGLRDLTVRLNDRRLLAAMAHWCGFAPDRHDSVFITLDKWDKLAPAAVREELARAGHPAAAIERMIGLFGEFDPGEGVEGIRKRLGGDGSEDAVQALTRIVRAVLADAAGRFALAFDPTLVRGMSYYTGPIFEVKAADFPSAIAGGGRYDQMIGKLLGRDVPATGFSVGFERVVALLADRSAAGRSSAKRLALFFEEGTGDLGPVLAAARQLRAAGHLVSMESRPRNLGGRLTALAAQGFDGFTVFDGGRCSEVRWFAGGERRAGIETER